MNTEVMAVAITGIDDKLITDAQNIGNKKKLTRPIYGICALAACLVLVFTFIFSIPKNGRATEPQLQINGNVISQEAVSVNTAVQVRRREIAKDISLWLNLETDRETEIQVSHGKMDICSSENTDTLYFTGTEYTTDKPVSIRWYIDDSDKKKSYKLTVDDDIIYTLSYDESDSCWSICKQ